MNIFFCFAQNSKLPFLLHQHSLHFCPHSSFYKFQYHCLQLTRTIILLLKIAVISHISYISENNDSCRNKSYGAHKLSNGHGFFESNLNHGFPFPLQCNKLTGPGCKSLHCPSRLSPPNPCWFHLCSTCFTFPANTSRNGGNEPNS